MSYNLEVNRNGQGWKPELNTNNVDQIDRRILQMESDRAKQRRQAKPGDPPLPNVSVRIVDAEGRTFRDARKLK